MMNFESCAEPLPPEAEEAIHLFNTGEYFEQHEVFELLWRAEPRPIRALYQGILQIGVGYLQITRGNLRGALKMIQRGQRWLAPLPDHCRGVDVAALRADAARVTRELQRVGLDGFDQTLLQPVKRV
jgi:predicted metal-dependent hydrolase